MADELDPDEIDALIAQQAAEAAGEPLPSTPRSCRGGRDEADLRRRGGAVLARRHRRADRRRRVPRAPSRMPVVHEPLIEDVSFADLPAVHAPIDQQADIDLLLDVPLQITVELGQAKRTIRELLELGQGSILHLDAPRRRAGGRARERPAHRARRGRRDRRELRHPRHRGRVARRSPADDGRVTRGCVRSRPACWACCCSCPAPWPSSRATSERSPTAAPRRRPFPRTGAADLGRVLIGLILVVLVIGVALRRHEARAARQAAGRPRVGHRQGGRDDAARPGPQPAPRAHRRPRAAGRRHRSRHHRCCRATTTRRP